MYSFIKTYWQLITLIVLAIITILSLLPAEQLPTVKGGDKIHHFIAYAFLTLPVAIKKPKYWQLILCSFLFYSGIIELIQGLFHRHGEWLDLVANTLGVLLGLIIGQLIIAMMNQFKSKKIEDLND